MKLPTWMKVSGIKQGIKPQPRQIEESGEYETYIDPKCGCKKRRKITKNIKNDETNGAIPKNGTDEIRTENGLDKETPTTKTEINKPRD